MAKVAALAAAGPSHEVADVEPYATSDEHLWDELRRIDQLLRAQTVGWRATLAAHKPERLWGMIHVSHEEVKAYLESPYAPPHEAPAELEEHLAPYFETASRLEAQIHERRGATTDVELRLDRLTRLFRLSPFEKDILLTVLLPELDPRYRRLYGYLMDDASRTRPTVELVLAILRPVEMDESVEAEEATGPGFAVQGRGAFDPQGPLLVHNLLVVEAGDRDEPLGLRSLRLDGGIAAYLLGSDQSDARLARILSRHNPDEDPFLPSRALLPRLEGLARLWHARGDDSDWGATVVLHGSRSSGRRTAAGAVARAVGVPLLVADAVAGLAAACGWERVVPLAFREARLAGAALLWNGCEALVGDGLQPAWDLLLRSQAEFPGVTFLTSTVPLGCCGELRDRPHLCLDVPPPTYEERCRLWQAYLPPRDAFGPAAPDVDTLAADLATSFHLNPGQIAAAATSAPSLAFHHRPERPELRPEHLYEACRRQSAHRLGTLAHRRSSPLDLTFDDLVLPSANRRQLQELRSRLRHRHRLLDELGFGRRLTLGRGILALFTGSSGTGKTLAAELLAKEQGVDLYKVDLSSVISKYIGETEKNLARIFAEAEESNALLLFDEADALFGKRGEVREAKDRWANQEVNYLLQRIEEHPGVVLLTTNLRQNLDEAFLRRIQVLVEFPFPDEAARLALWRLQFPPEVESPPEEKLRPLAQRFRLAGGDIRNIVLDAAYRALEEGETADSDKIHITLRHLVRATVGAYRKAGRPVTPSEFGEEWFGWVERQDVTLGAE